MDFMENDLVLYGRKGEEIDWVPFASASIGQEDSQSRGVNDPYLSVHLGQDYSYINANINTEEDSMWDYLDVLS